MFPGFNQPFHLYTDAHDQQLGATLSTLVKSEKALGFYTWKINSTQLNYTVREKELKGKSNVFVCMKRFDSTWIACYLCPRAIGSNNGENFMADFSKLCDNMGLKQQLSSSWNPQSNAILCV